jgi:phosphoglycerol transferase
MSEAQAPRPAPVLAHKPSAIYIYAEGLEAAFLDPVEFPGLAPRLHALAARGVQIHGIKQVPFTGWTIAGQVASNCGFPGLAGNVLFADNGDRWPCASNLLAKDGYQMVYLNGSSLEFSGKGEFWKNRGYSRVLGDVQINALAGEPDAEMSAWGAYDDTLFKAAEQEYTRLKATGQPYVLTLLTVDTHAPNGMDTPTCRHLPLWRGRNGEDDLMFQSVRCADQVIGDFLDKILPQLPADTYVILQSDHLQPPKATAYTALGDSKDRENLFVVWGQDLPAGARYRHGTMFDVAPTFLSILKRDPGGLNLGRDLLGKAPTLVEQHGLPWMVQRMNAAMLDDRMGDARFVVHMRSEEAKVRLEGKAPLRERGTGDPELRARWEAQGRDPAALERTIKPTRITEPADEPHPQATR